MKNKFLNFVISVVQQNKYHRYYLQVIKDIDK